MGCVMSGCEYARNQYSVPAVIGRRVVVSGRPGIIAADRGHYIGVNFDEHKPGVISNCHPTSEVEYGGMGTIRQPTMAQRRYQRFLEYGECFDSFIEFCRWDRCPERSWNSK